MMSHRVPRFQVTTWGLPYEMIETSFGALGHATHAKIAYKHWCELETHRWHEKNHREAWIEENSEGLVAMFTKPEWMVELGEEEGAQ